MKLPPWDCSTVEEQNAFADFVMRKLDEPDEAVAIAYVNAPIPEGFMEHLDDQARRHEAAQAARQLGLEIKPPPRPRGRPKGEITAIVCAIRDVERMRDIFQQYWGKSNRYSRPTRTVIAAEYWRLSEIETEALERHFNKAKPAEE